MNELESLVSYAMKANASDIHLADGQQPRIRVSNELIALPREIPANTQLIFSQILEKYPEKTRDIYKEKLANLRDIDCAFTSINGARVRVNVYNTFTGLSISMRILPMERLSAEDIGIPFAAIKGCRAKSGIFIFAGATGSGKTTSMAAIIDTINNTRNAHIITIEDPVENVIKSKKSLVSQREVGVQTPDFHLPLRSALREDPDIVVLGEMRDLETTRTAIELAETGHLVLTTLHTRNASASIERLIEQFPSMEQNQIRLMISNILVGVLSQTLVSKRNGGRIAAFELLLSTPSVRNLIREQKIALIYSEIQTSSRLGMVTMEDSLLKLVEKGLVTPAEAISKLQVPQILIDKMKMSNLVNKNELAEIL